MASKEDIASLQQQLAAHRQTLSVLLWQRAALGALHAPPGVFNGILEARGHIIRIKTFLREQGITVEDSPGDADTSLASNSDETADNQSIVLWQNTGNLYWIGHDLRWAMDSLASEGISPTLQTALRQALHHAQSLGLDTLTGSPLVRLDEPLNAPERLTFVSRLIQETIPERLLRLLHTVDIYIRDQNLSVSAGTTDSISQEVWEIILYLGKLAEAKQPDFKPFL